MVRDDVNQLSNILYESLGALLVGKDMANDLTTSAEGIVLEIKLGGCPVILDAGFLEDWLVLTLKIQEFKCLKMNKP